MRRGVTPALLSLLSLGATSCGDDLPEFAVRKTIGSQGGLVSSHDEVLSIVIQPGALPGPIDIIIFPSDEPPLIFGDAYRVKPDVPLLVPAEITYQRKLPELEYNAAIAAIRSEDYSGGGGYWTPLKRLTLDLATESITSRDTELALYYGMLATGANNGDDDDDDDDDDDSAICGDGMLAVELCFVVDDEGVGTEPVDVTLGNFDGALGLDIATANRGSDNVSILLGDGEGDFTGGGIIDALAPAVGIAAGDLDGDGNWDINIAAGDTLVPVRSLGGGEYMPFDPIPLEAAVLDMAATDLTGDMIDDLMLLTDDGMLSAFTFDGAGFAVATMSDVSGFIESPVGVAGGLFFAQDATSDAIVFGGPAYAGAVGNGDGLTEFLDEAAGMAGSDLGRAIGADLTGDGMDDVAVVDRADGGVYVLTNGGGTFQPLLIQTGDDPSDVVAADLNGDAAPDLAVTNAGDDTVTIIVRSGVEWVAQEPFSVGNGPSAITAGDLNVDQRMDLVVANADGDSVTVVLSDP